MNTTDCAVLSLQIHNLSREVRLFVTIFNCSISLFSIVINCLTISVVLFHKNLWTKSNAILCVLAAVDFVTGGASEPIFMVDIFDIGDLQTACSLDKARIFLSTFLFLMSMCTLAMVSYDRYLHMTKLTNYDLVMTKNRVICLLSFCFFWSSFIGALRLVNHVAGRLLAKVLFVASLVILTLFIGKFYLKIYRVNKRSITRVSQTQDQNQDNADAEGDNQPSQMQLRSKGLSTTFWLISLCLIICWLPMLAFLVVLTIFETVMGTFEDTNLPLNVLFLVAWTAGNLKSALNPIIYIYRNRELKDHIYRFCREKILRRRPLPEADTTTASP